MHATRTQIFNQISLKIRPHPSTAPAPTTKPYTRRRRQRGVTNRPEWEGTHSTVVHKCMCGTRTSGSNGRRRLFEGAAIEGYTAVSSAEPRRTVLNLKSGVCAKHARSSAGKRNEWLLHRKRKVCMLGCCDSSQPQYRRVGVHTSRSVCGGQRSRSSSSSMKSGTKR